MTIVSMPSNADARDCAVLLSKLFKQAVTGHMDGIAVSYSTLDGELTAMAGKYARDKAAALKASLRQSVALGLFEAKAKQAADLVQLRPRRTR